MGEPLPFLGGRSCDGEASKPWIEVRAECYTIQYSTVQQRLFGGTVFLLLLKCRAFAKTGSGQTHQETLLTQRKLCVSLCFHTQELLLHDSLNKSKSSSGPFPVKRVPIGFADDVTAELYFPAGTNATSPPLQVVIVLPGFFYNTGVCGTKFPFFPFFAPSFFVSAA